MQNAGLPVAPLTAVAAAAAAVFVAGLLLVLVGRRGRRVDDHPLCRRCGFDLFAKPADSTACPECGADVTRRPRRAVRIGHRVRRGKLVLAGALLMVVSSAGLGTSGVRWARSVDWQAHKPADWLLRELDAA